MMLHYLNLKLSMTHTSIRDGCYNQTALQVVGTLRLEPRHSSGFAPTTVNVSLKTFSFDIMETSANWEQRGYSRFSE